MMIGRALCRDDLLADWCGVFLVCSWRVEGRQGEENVAWVTEEESGATNLFCCCLAASGEFRQPNTVGAVLCNSIVFTVFYVK